MSVEVPMKGPAVVPEVTIKLQDWRSMNLRIDCSKCPSEAMAIAILEKALRVLKNEEANAASVAFAQRLAQENIEAQAMAAMTHQRKQ